MRLVPANLLAHIPSKEPLRHCVKLLYPFYQTILDSLYRLEYYGLEMHDRRFSYAFIYRCFPWSSGVAGWCAELTS